MYFLTSKIAIYTVDTREDVNQSSKRYDNDTRHRMLVYITVVQSYAVVCSPVSHEEDSRDRQLLLEGHFQGIQPRHW